HHGLELRRRFVLARHLDRPVSGRRPGFVEGHLEALAEGAAGVGDDDAVLRPGAAQAGGAGQADGAGGQQELPPAEREIGRGVGILAYRHSVASCSYARVVVATAAPTRPVRSTLAVA